MTMSRQELDEKLVDYLFDELSDVEATRFESEVAAYPDLAAEVQAHKRTRAACAELPEREMSPAVMQAVMREARAAVDTADESMSWLDRLGALLMQPALAMAGVVLVLGAVSASLLVQGDEDHVPEVFASKVEVPEEATPAEVAALRASPTFEAATARAPSARSAAGVEGGGLPRARLEGGAPQQGETSAEGLKPVSPALSRLIEVEADELAQVFPPQGQKRVRKVKSAAKRRSTSSLLSNKGKAEGAKSRVASTPMRLGQAKGAEGLDSQRTQGSAPRPTERAKGASLQGAEVVSAPPSRGADEVSVKQPRIAPQIARADRSSASPASRSKSRRAKALNKGGDSSEGEARKRAKRLSAEFDRHLKKGEGSKASQALEKLAKIPGFEAVAKRKRSQLRKWMKSRTKGAKGKSY